MDRLKILHYPLEVRSRGMEMYMAEHWRVMNRERFVCDFVTFSEGAILEPLLSEDGAHVFYIPFERRQGQDLLNRMEQILQMGQYDVLHLHLRRWNMRDLAVLELAQRMGVPRILIHAHCAGIDKDCRSEHQQAMAQLKLSPAVVLCACSQRAGEFMFGKHAKTQQLHILKNAIDIARFSYTEESNQTAPVFLDALNPHRQGRVLTVAHMDFHQKNFPFMIQIIEQWINNHPQGWWGVAGAGKNYKEFIECWSTVNRVNCSPFLEVWAIQKYLQTVDCLLLASRYEGVPRVLIEAQACGLPCLVSEEAVQDVPCSELVHTLPLTASVKVWENQLSQLVQNRPINRACALELLQSEGYEIHNAVQILEHLYEEGNH